VVAVFHLSSLPYSNFLLRKKYMRITNSTYDARTHNIFRKVSILIIEKLHKLQIS